MQARVTDGPEDQCGSTGELHDLFMGPAWTRLTTVVAEIFAGLGPDDVVLDLGAGTGLGTMALVRHTRAEVWALEPDELTRTALVHRVAADEEAATRVSVVAGRVPDHLDLVPAGVTGVVVAHALGHLDASDRTGLWAHAARVLAPAGVVLLTCQEQDRDTPHAEPDRAERVQDQVEEVVLGRHRYRATHQGARNLFRTHDEVLDELGGVVRESRVSGTWRPIGSRQVTTEVAVHGLVSGPGPVNGTVLVTHR